MKTGRTERGRKSGRHGGRKEGKYGKKVGKGKGTEKLHGEYWNTNTRY